MRVGKQDNALTAISTSDLHSVNIRGRELSSELIGHVSFTDMFFLLVTGVMPDDRQRKIMDAVLVAIAEHGLVPSNVASRVTFAASPDSMQGAVAAGILGCGTVVLGSSETAGRFYASIVAMSDSENLPLRTVAEREMEKLKALKRHLPGFGHPQHKEGDPRAIRLLAIAREIGSAGRHVEVVKVIEDLVPTIYGRQMPLNVSGAIPAVALDAGFPAAALRGIPILARTASLVAHVHEEMNRPIGFILAGNASEGIGYDGSPLNRTEGRE
jgi:citrate synthase